MPAADTLPRHHENGGAAMVGMRTIRSLAIMVTVGSAAGCSGASSHSAFPVRHATYSYSCCASTDVDQVRHPGDLLTVHWIVTESPAAGTKKASEPVTLAATLTGAFPDVASLKGSPAAAKALPTSVLHTTTWTGGAPITRLQIPATAAPGFYNLSTQVSSGGGTLGGAAIIQVTLKH
jgi:hypothetical protein